MTNTNASASNGNNMLDKLAVNPPIGSKLKNIRKLGDRPNPGVKSPKGLHRFMK